MNSSFDVEEVLLRNILFEQKVGEFIQHVVEQTLTCQYFNGALFTSDTCFSGLKRLFSKYFEIKSSFYHPKQSYSMVECKDCSKEPESSAESETSSVSSPSLKSN